MDYNYFMRVAIEQAHQALKLNEVPIGAVVVFENEIISSGFNLRTLNNNVLHHAEIIAIDEACKKLNSWRLEGCSIFVTVEPCPMCAGAILQARFDEVVFGTKNKKAGCCGSVLNILDNPDFNHRVKITSGIMQEECQTLMSNFFRKLRSDKASDK